MNSNKETLKKYSVKATVALDGFVLPRFLASPYEGAPMVPTGVKVVTLDRNSTSGINVDIFPDR